jgi:hypothetical protein
MAYTDVFLGMYSSYRSRFGAIFPSTNPRSVLLVLRECCKPGLRTQKQIEHATGLSQSIVAKLIAKMIECELLERSERDPKTGEKKVRVPFRGQGALITFEKACKTAAKKIPKT